MSCNWSIAVFLFVFPVPKVALADMRSTVTCIDVSLPKIAIKSLDGHWTELTSEEFQFIRGVYAMNPGMPDGLPYGDRAALAQIDGIDGGVVYFIDGDKACMPMEVPSEILTMMHDIVTKVVTHEGRGT